MKDRYSAYKIRFDCCHRFLVGHFQSDESSRLQQHLHGDYLYYPYVTILIDISVIPWPSLKFEYFGIYLLYSTVTFWIVKQSSGD